VTNPETARDLLARAESYLSALHGSVARHDNLAANLGCAGCELRNQIAAELCRDAAVSVPPPATRADDQAALRDRIAKALAGTELKPPFPHCLAAANAVLAVLPEPADRADRVAVLAEVADWLKAWRPEFFERWAITEQERYEGGVDDAAAELRRLADESGPCVAGEQQNETPEAEAPVCGHRPDHCWGCPGGCASCQCHAADRVGDDEAETP
jgi:hypothetical protein